MKWKKIFLIIGIVLVILIVTAGVYIYPAYKFFSVQGSTQVDKDLIIVKGGGGNSGILVTDSAVVVIDTKMGGDAEKLFNKAREKAGRKKIIVINTHYHGDHLRGNHFYKGSPIYIGAYDQKFLKDNIEPGNMPDHFVADTMVMNLGNETIYLRNLGQGHTWDDMIVWLKNRNVVFTGDLVFDHVNPVLKKESGANVDKWIGALDRILAMPAMKWYIPGHGEVADRSIVVSMKDYFLDMKIAAGDPSKEEAIKEKYKSWVEMPMMASPGMTIDYIRGK